MRKKRGIVVGFDYYANFLAALVNEYSDSWKLRAYDDSRTGTVRAVLALRHADALICFGGPAPNTALVEAARRRKLPVFVIWAGSDVAKARNDPFGLEVFKQEHFINLSDGPWLVDELRELGIEAEYVPVTAVRAGPPLKPFPQTFRVLSYLPEPRRDFYGAELVYAAARAMPEVPFLVVGVGGKDERAPANVQFCGMVQDMPDKLDSCTVLLRHPEHDGKSMLVLETLARARHVSWNYKFPAVATASGLEQVIGALSGFKKRHGEGTLELNQQGRSFALRDFGRERIAANFEARLEDGVRDWASRRRSARHVVAISGLALFCAEVAQYATTYAPEWAPRLLHTKSRLDVLTSIYTLARSDVWYSIGNPITDRWLHLASRLLHKPRVLHWVGSDLGGLSDDPSLLRMLRVEHPTHLAEVHWTAAQLRSFGLDPRIAPLPPRHTNTGVESMPDHFTVMLYVPRTRSDFYGCRSFERLMQRLRDRPIKYIVVGGGHLEAPPGVDVEDLGWRDTLTDVYERASVLIRFTPRDGLSLMVLEALAFGRHVLWTQDFPYTRPITTFDDMEREVIALADAHSRGELRPQSDAAELVMKQYGPKSCIEMIAAAWSDALAMSSKGERLPAMETL